MILSSAEILSLVEKPKNKHLLDRAREIFASHRLHLKGEGLQEFLYKIEGYDNEEQYLLRKKLAKATTVPIYAKETDLMNKVFSAQGFSRYYQFNNSRQEKLVADFSSYLSTDIGDGLTIKQWMRDIWLDRVNYDSTGVAMIELPEQQTTALPEPYVVFKSVLDIHDITLLGNKVEYIIIKKEIVTEKDGKYYTYRVVDDLFDYIVTAKDGVYKIDESKTLSNPWGYVPAKVISTQRDSKSKARTSYIWKSIDVADEYLIDSSIHSITKKIHGFPRYWERARGCKTCKGNGTHTELGPDRITPITRTCGTCGGSGSATKSDVSDKIVVPTLTQNGQPDNVPVGGYIQIDNDTPHSQIEFMDRMERAIHKGVWANKFDEKMFTEAETATGIMVDVQAVFDKLSLMSENAQEVELFIVNGLAEIRYGADFLGAVINYGKKYFVRSADEIEKLYGLAKKNGLPTTILDAYIEELIYVRFGNDSMELDRQLKLKEIEPFVHLSVIEMNAMENILPRDKIMKIYLTDFVSQYEDEVGPISFSNIEEIEAKLIEYANEKMLKGALTGAEPITGGGDSLGKIPLALQQLALSREREIGNNNIELANKISMAMTDLTKRLISVTAEPVN